MEFSGYFSCPSLFTPKQQSSITHQTGGCMEPIDGLDMRNLLPSLEIELQFFDPLAGLSCHFSE
jgi:hypothetical protein